MLHVLDLDAVEGPVGDDVLAALSDRSAVVVGTASRPLDATTRGLAALLDTTLTTWAHERGPSTVRVADLDAAVQQLACSVDATPRAALVLAALLRQTPWLPVAEALAAEAAAYSTLLAGPEFAAWLRRRGPGRVAAAGDAADRVRTTRVGDVLEVRLARPWRRNAVDAAMRVALVDALTMALLDPDLHVVLRADGPVFCAGGDLDEFGSAADPATAFVVRTAEAPGRLLARLGHRAEVHVHGACAGAGVELPAFAARVVAAPGTTFRLPELAMGLLPGAGGTVSLPRRTGRWRAAWMALTGSSVDAATALDWGLVDEVTA